MHYDMPKKCVIQIVYMFIYKVVKEIWTSMQLELMLIETEGNLFFRRMGP